MKAKVMKENFTQIEYKYFNKIEEIGGKYGDSEELKRLSREAYDDYQTGVISSKAYGRMYAMLMDYAYPR